MLFGFVVVVVGGGAAAAVLVIPSEATSISISTTRPTEGNFKYPVASDAAGGGGGLADADVDRPIPSSPSVYS